MIHIQTFARRLVAGLAGLALFGLAACSSTGADQPGVGAQGLQALRGILASRNAEPLRPTAGFPGLDPRLIAGQTVPILGAYVASRGAVAALAIAGRNNDIYAWRSSDGIGLSVTGAGLVVGTNGFGPDLSGSDVGQTARLLAEGRSGNARRSMVFRDGDYVAHRLELSCTVSRGAPERLVLNGRSFETIRFDESCTAPAGSNIAPFTNQYWRDRNGPMIRQSVQWLGAGLGPVALQRLIE